MLQKQLTLQRTGTDKHDDMAASNNHGFLLTAFIFLSTLNYTSGFMAYDCQEGRARYQALDLREPADCAEPRTLYKDPVSQRVQILQTTSTLAVEAQFCKVHRTREVVSCGFGSISYANDWVEWETMIDLTPRQCRDAIKYGILKVDGLAIKARWRITDKK